MLIENPILRGFNPDPSIIRVGKDYYLATSTFEWFPGVQIHHSRDLINWTLVARPLNRSDQLDLKGVPDSCGVWAPCLSYDKGTFYLVYSNVKSFDGVWKDTPNFLVTTNDITSEWSEPVFLNSMGFDGSLYHDENGRKWYTSMLVDHRGGKFFGGIILQEYDPDKKSLTGEVFHIFNGTELGRTEGPHLYKKDGFYYLIAAEGGTEYGHAITVARATDITGPYVTHPENPLLTSRDHPGEELQKCGHGDLFQTENGDWMVVFLTGRPLSTRGRCTLGRETALEQIHWPANEWPALKTAKRTPRISFSMEGEGAAQYQTEFYDDFDKEEPDVRFQSLRIPVTESWLSLKKRKSYLRLYGRESLSSLHHQSLIARRVQDFRVRVKTKLDFQPESFQQMAGLVFYYNTSHFHYLHITFNGTDRVLSVITCDKGRFTEPLEEPFLLPGVGEVGLGGTFLHDRIRFMFNTEDTEWRQIGPPLDGSILSDDYVRDEENIYRPAFTGSFIGLCCQDLSGKNLHADFDWFSYEENVR